MIPAVVITQSKPVFITAVRPVSVVVPKIKVTRPRLSHLIVTKSKSPIKRYITHSPSPKTNNLPPRVTAVQALVVSAAQGNMSYLFDFEELNGGYVAFGGNLKGGKIFGKGKLRQNSVLFTDIECIVLSLDFKLHDDSQVLLRVPRENNMYNLNLKNIVPSGDLTCLFAKATLDESNLWHRRLGHINFKTINKLVKGNLVRRLPSKVFENDNTCVACKKGKQHRAFCKTKPVSFVDQPLYRLHMDLFGPTFVKSLNKKSYCLVVINDYSRMKRIKREFSVPRTPQQNGIAERKNETLIEAAKTMLEDSLLPIPFWAEAVNTTCYVQNRVLVTKPHYQTPYELLHGRTPSIGFMRPFGCPEHDFDAKKSESNVSVSPSSSAQSKKQDDKTKKEAKGKKFEDFSDNSINEDNAVGTLVSAVGQLSTNNANTFSVAGPSNADEEVYDCQPLGFEDLDYPNKVYKVVKALYGLHQALRAWFYKMMNELTRNQCKVTNHQVNVQFLLQLQQEWQRFVTLVKQSQELKNVSYHKLYDILKQHQHEVNEIRAEKIARVANPLALVAQQQQVYHPQTHPTHYNQHSSTRTHQSATRNRGKAIVNSPQPIYDQEPPMVDDDDETSKEKEIDKLIALISLDNSPRIHRNAGYESQRSGNVAGARETVGSLMVQKYRIQCYNYKEYGHVARECQKPKRAKDVAYHREKMLLCKQEEVGIQLNTKQADWKDDTDDESDDPELEAHYMYMAKIQESAFLYGTIEEEVYVCQPIGFEDPDHQDKVYKVVKALYGLHQAPRACQDKYVAEILRKFRLTEGKSASTPIDTKKPLLKDPDGEDVDVHTYRSMISSLMYLTSSRPDIMFACKKQTVFATSSTEAEYVATASIPTGSDEFPLPEQLLIVYEDRFPLLIQSDATVKKITFLLKTGEHQVVSELGEKL
nr:hypothetical protein [Tanacetum cinerariifolium]